MDLRRAEEILTTPSRVDVFYNGKEVWIENVSSRDNVVEIKEIGSTHRTKVPVFDLTER